jgi:hypothetical protein
MMICRTLFASTFSIALLITMPAFAQDGSDEAAFAEEAGPEADADSDALADLPPELAALATLFGTAEPLTAEQEARLPTADRVAASLVPEGAFVKLIQTSAAPVIETMLGTLADNTLRKVSRQTGLSPSILLEVEPGAIEQAEALLDPYSDDREQLRVAMLERGIATIAGQVEPSFRTGLARAYAARFSESELSDLLAFFDTPAGARFATEAVPILADPQVMSAMNALIPAMIATLPDTFEQLELADREFPRAKFTFELSEGERAQLAKLLGVSPQELKEADTSLRPVPSQPPPPPPAKNPREKSGS